MKRLLLILAASIFFSLANSFAQEEKSPWYEYYDVLSYSELRALIDGGEVEEARILNDGWWVTVKRKDGEYFDVRVTPQTPIADHFYDAGIPVRIEHSSKDEIDDKSRWLEVFYNFLPLLIFLVFLFFIFVVMGSVNKKNAKKYDEQLNDAKKLNDELLDRTEKLQNEFLNRLETILVERKNSNG